MKGETIYMTLDGSLHSMPISLMQEHLAEDEQVRLISASKDLISLKNKSKKPSQKSVVVPIQHLTFNSRRQQLKIRGRTFYLTRMDEIASWKPLPGHRKKAKKSTNCLMVYIYTKTKQQVMHF